MAFVVLYTIEDEKGISSTTEVNVPGTASFDNAAVFAVEMAQLINALIRGAIRRVGLAFLVDISGAGLRAAPLADSDVEEGARFQFRTANGFYTGLRIPTFDEAKIVAASRDVDLADSDVAAFVTAMTTGINLIPAGGTGTLQPSDKREEDIVSLTEAKEQFVSSRG